MITRYIINCDCARPDWPFLPVNVPCGSARTLGVIGLKSRVPGIEITGCQIRVVNADGQAMTKTCKLERGVWVATFPASHFQRYGTVKKGVVVYAVGKDESGEMQTWIERVGDLRISPVDSSSAAAETVAQPPGDVYHKSTIVNGVQHYKREVLTYSERQQAWGADYVGDYVFVGGEFVPYTSGGEG